MITSIAFIAQPVRDMGATRRFYAGIPGLTSILEMGDTWAEFAAADGTAIALDTYTPKTADNPAPYLALESDNIEADVAALKAAGGQVARDVWVNQDGDGNEVCRMALVLDPEGNPLMLHQMPPGRTTCC